MNDLSPKRLREVLHYDAESGVFTWLIAPSSRALKGSRAGAVRPDGYRTIGVDGASYLAHRLAVFYMTCRWPKADVDHINLIPGDDRWRNLREASRAENKANIRPPRTNSSGIKGVTWNKKDRRWRAQIKVSGKHRVIGGYLTKAEAASAYERAAREAFGEFARVA